LSSSGSTISSPPSSCGMLQTPVNGSFFPLEKVEGVKEGCESEVLAESLAYPDWSRAESPPLTPGEPFIFFLLSGLVFLCLWSRPDSWALVRTPKGRRKRSGGVLFGGRDDGDLGWVPELSLTKLVCVPQSSCTRRRLRPAKHPSCYALTLLVRPCLHPRRQCPRLPSPSRPRSLCSLRRPPTSAIRVT
jgi:hypothetical protein